LFGSDNPASSRGRKRADGRFDEARKAREGEAKREEEER
jgi:hypothetical protein